MKHAGQTPCRPVGHRHTREVGHPVIFAKPCRAHCLTMPACMGMTNLRQRSYPNSVGLDIEIGDLERVFFDECATWVHHVSHQRREDLIRSDGVFDAHAQQTT